LYIFSNFKEESLYEIIIYFLNNDKLDKANDLIKEFSRNFGRSEYYKDILILQAEKLTLGEKYSESLSIYGFIIKNFKESKDLDNIYYWGGYAAEKTKDISTAKDYLNIVIKEYEESTFYKDALIILSSIYGQGKDHVNEKKILQSLLKIEKDINKINEYNKRLKIIEKINMGMDEKEASLLIRVEKGEIEAKLELAEYYYQNNDIEKSKKLFNEILIKDKNIIGSKANIGLGNIEFDNKKYKEAVSIFLNTIKAYKTTNEIKAESLYKTAFTYFRMNKNDASKKVLQKLFSSFPDSEWTTKGKELEGRIDQ